MERKTYVAPKLETRGNVSQQTRGSFGLKPEGDPNHPNQA